MFDELAKLIFDYSHAYKLADSNFVNTAINILSNYYHINNYIKELSIISSSDKKRHEGSSYDLDKFKLTINLVNELNKKKYNINDIKKRIIYYNLEIIRILFHEFDHIILRRQFDINANTIDVVLSKKIFDIYSALISDVTKSNQTVQDRYNEIILEKMLEYYYFNHNKAPFERRANIRSLTYMNEIIKIFYETSWKDTIKFYELKNNKKYKKILKENYKLYRKCNFTNSPSLDYFIRLDYKNKDKNELVKLYYENKLKSFMVTSKKYSLYEKVLYGLQLSKDELNEIKHSKKILYKK